MMWHHHEGGGVIILESITQSSITYKLQFDLMNDEQYFYLVLFLSSEGSLGMAREGEGDAVFGRLDCNDNTPVLQPQQNKVRHNIGSGEVSKARWCTNVVSKLGHHSDISLLPVQGQVNSLKPWLQWIHLTLSRCHIYASVN